MKNENCDCEILSIKSCVDIDKKITYLDITISAASEINFSVIDTRLDIDHILVDLFEIIPSLIEYDTTMMEICDGTRGLKINPEWVKKIRRFKEKYDGYFLSPLEICD